jgi:cysteine desulfurase
VNREGELRLEDVKKALCPDTALVSIMWANNETGVLSPVEKIGPFLKEKGILFHVDGVQAAGKIPMDVEGTGIDLLSLSAHKFHGPKGVGILYVRSGLPLSPVLFGGPQEKGFRPGTENVPGIIGMGRAAALALEFLIDENTRVRSLRDSIEETVKQIPRAFINGLHAPRIPNTLNVSFPGVEGEALLLRLDEEGFCASSGSACTAETIEPSHVLKAMGLRDEEALSSVRFSLSRFNTEEEVGRLNHLLPRLVRELREISTFKT